MQTLSFDSDKTIEAIAYIAGNLPEHNQSTYFVVKMFYFADKCHLERYGRQITGDTYIAMKNGPVPSGAYDIIKGVQIGSCAVGVEHAAHVFTVNDNNITGLSDPNLELFSDSEIECLDEAIERYGHLTFGQIMAVSHDTAWQLADKNDNIDLLEIAKTLPNGLELVEHLSSPYPD